MTRLGDNGLVMTREQVMDRLQRLKDLAAFALKLLESPHTKETAETIRQLTDDLRQELATEYERVISDREQRSMTMFELSVYLPSIEDAWTKSKIKRVKTEQTPNAGWSDPLEAVLYHLGKFI
jgi:hypothetical protein